MCYFSWCFINIWEYICIVEKCMENQMAHKINCFSSTNHDIVFLPNNTCKKIRLIYTLHCTTKTLMSNKWALFLFVLYHIANSMKHYFRMKWPAFLPLHVWWTVFNGNSIWALSNSLSSESVPESLGTTCISVIFHTTSTINHPILTFTITFYHWLWQRLHNLSSSHL